MHFLVIFILQFLEQGGIIFGFSIFSSNLSNSKKIYRLIGPDCFQQAQKQIEFHHYLVVKHVVLSSNDSSVEFEFFRVWGKEIYYFMKFKNDLSLESYKLLQTIKILHGAKL